MPRVPWVPWVSYSFSWVNVYAHASLNPVLCFTVAGSDKVEVKDQQIQTETIETEDQQVQVGSMALGMYATCTRCALK